eukprot:TRINITY_DN813_c0_g1_i1.p1 TRINITY_DN813_c0_g1~~TRINITY_DN813_c0_g1_i1.p1  ORF type:complete len:651 (-),score=271.04 TRINITY_DN813_c0_g1_i1:49-2001(-)
MTQADLEAFYAFFWIIAQKEIGEKVGLQLNYPKLNDIELVDNGSIWESASGVISKGCELWTGFVNAFKSSKSTQIVGQLEGKGFSYYRQSASIQKIGGLDPSYLDTFLSHLLVRIKVPEHRVEEVKYVIMDCIFMEGTDWKIYDNVFDKDTKGTAKMVQLMMNRDENTGKTNWLIADLEGEFKLAPDLLYVQTSKSIAGGIWSSSKVEIKTVPKAMTQADLEAFYAFFWIIAQKEIGEKVGLQLNYPKLNDIELVDNGSIWESASGVISKGCELWTGFVNAFKSSKSTQIVGQLEGKGFSYYRQSASIQKIGGLDPSYLDTFLSHLLVRIKVPEHRVEEVKYVIMDCIFMEGTDWKIYDNVFDKDTKGTAKMVQLMMNRDENTGKTNWLIADLEGEFKLAPDLLYVQTSKSIAGGIWSSSKVEIKTIPRSMTQADLEAFYAFFWIIAQKEIGEKVGLQLNYPKLNDIELVDNGSIWESASGVISKGCELWTGFVNAFKSSKSTQIVGQLEGKGFSYYRQSASIQKIGGLDPSYLDTFLSHLLVRIKVPEHRVEEVKYVIMDCIFMEGTDWKIYDNVFDKDTKGTAKMVQLMMNRDENTGKTNWLIADLEGEFKLAPDLLYVQTSKSIAGGIWSSSKVEIKDVPRLSLIHI